MASVLRESTDDSAPVLSSRTPGSMNNLLKKVLVEGYGTQSPLGWSVMFENLTDHLLVLRGGSGTRFPVLFNDAQSQLNYRITLVTAYESMADINTGYMPCPDTNFIDHKYIQKSIANVDGNVPWKIIGDDKGFWILTGVGHSYASTASYNKFLNPHYIGDYTPYDISVRHNFMTILAHSNHIGYFQPNANLVSWVMRDPQSKEPGAIQFFPLCSHSGGTYLFGNNIGPSISPLNGRYLYEPVWFFTNSIGSVNAGNYQYPGGCVPGFFNMLYRGGGYNTSNTYFNASSVAELEPFFEITDDRKMFIFSFRYSTNDGLSSNQGFHRGSIIVGEGFRDAC